MKFWAENWAKEMRYLRHLPPTPRPEKPNPTVRVSRRPVTELVVHINGVETAHAEVGARDQQINDYHGGHDHSLINLRWSSQEYPTPDQRAFFNQEFPQNFDDWAEEADRRRDARLREAKKKREKETARWVPRIPKGWPLAAPIEDAAFPSTDIATEIAPIYFGWYDQTPLRSSGWSVRGVQEPPWWRRKQKQEEEQ